MYPSFGLTLMVTHACNMRCSYCYAGRKRARAMPERVGRRAIDRALASLGPGGTLNLSFFGGEPALEALLVTRLMDYARSRAAASCVRVGFALTTNGTVADGLAWSLMTMRDVEIAVSFDGLPEVHDRHRRLPGGRPEGEPTSARVLATMLALLRAGKRFRVVTVVRPGTAASLPDGLVFLKGMGVCGVDLTLDLWTRWRPEDAAALELALARAADVWREGLGDFAVSWFDEKTARLGGFDPGPCGRCGFGAGEVAVAPSGNLYPCERLICNDGASEDPVRLPGHALDGDDFLGFEEAPARCAPACSACSAASLCNTTCRCSNYVRTGDVAAPDRLLCMLNRWCIRETADALAPPKRCQEPFRARKKVPDTFSCGKEVRP